jgi:hypothetical protein
LLVSKEVTVAPDKEITINENCGGHIRKC